MKSAPGWVDATKASHTGTTKTATPRASTACAAMVKAGLFSTMRTSVVNLALDEAELRQRQRYHDGHQHHRLNRRSAEIKRFEPVLEHLVDQDRGGVARTAGGRGVNDSERIEERVDDVDDEKEERRRPDQRQDDGAKAPCRPGAVDRRRLDQRARARLQRGEEEYEIVRHLLPRGGHHDEDERMGAVEQRIPVEAEARQRIGVDAGGRVQQEP